MQVELGWVNPVEEYSGEMRNEPVRPKQADRLVPLWNTARLRKLGIMVAPASTRKGRGDRARSGMGTSLLHAGLPASSCEQEVVVDRKMRRTRQRSPAKLDTHGESYLNSFLWDIIHHQWKLFHPIGATIHGYFAGIFKSYIRLL